MEIMGLAIIVILIMLGVLFAIRFVLLAPDEDVAGEFRESQLVSNTLTVMVQTHTDCQDATVAALLQDCATTGSLRCPRGDACAHVRSVFEGYFAETFDRWQREYDFSVSGNRRVEDIRVSRGKCSAEMARESEAAETHVPTTAGTITLSFRLCR